MEDVATVDEMNKEIKCCETIIQTFTFNHYHMCLTYIYN